MSLLISIQGSMVGLTKTYCLGLPEGEYNPDSNVHGANMGPIWGRQDPGGPHICPMNFAIWGVTPINN